MQTELHRSFYGYLIGCTSAPDDEAAANYAFHEAVKEIAKFHTTP